jgi:hypothetical protein
MVWALTLIACVIVFSPRIIAYLIPGWVGLSVIGLLIFWPHTPEWMHSVVAWGIGALLAAFLIAIPLRLFLGIPIMAGTIGLAVLGLVGEAAQIIGKVWDGITSAVGAITPAQWVIAGVVIAGSILVKCCIAWKQTHPPLADDDDDDFDDDPTDTPPVIRPAPPRLSRAERKAAAIYAEIERKAKVSAAWEAWYSGRGPGPF